MRGGGGRCKNPAVPPPQLVSLPSRNQIDKAGKYLRDVANETIEPDLDRLAEAWSTVTLFREAHAYPMGKVRLGLASMVNTEGIDGAVSQRHKRVPRIVRKLVRHHGTALVRLEDIGGCRVVVPDVDAFDRICRRIRKNWAGVFTRDPRDYVRDPKPMGYRAMHFVVKRDDRAIEVQVRTAGQQRWADAVELLDGRFGFNLKDEEGPESLRENFVLAGEVIRQQEMGAEIDADLISRMVASNERVVREGYYGS